MKYDITVKYTLEFLRGCIDDDLHELLNQAKRCHFELRVQSSPTGRVKLIKTPHLFKKVKKDIARIKTVLREWSRT